MEHVASSLTIAGTDPTGGAGIQADLKTFQELKSYGMSVITSVVAQDTTGVKDVHHIPLSTLEKQLDAVFSDIPVHALKTGMIANQKMMEIIHRFIKENGAPYVIDPVMVTTSGDTLIDHQARDYLRDYLVPIAAVVTPNIPEAEYLTGENITDEVAMQKAAQTIVHKFGAGAALIKGGHMSGDAIDYLYDGKEMTSFSVKRVDTKNTHGTGCTYSAAITAYLSHGYSLYDSVNNAKAYITEAIKHSFDIGAGSGPTNHWANRIDR